MGEHLKGHKHSHRRPAHKGRAVAALGVVSAAELLLTACSGEKPPNIQIDQTVISGTSANTRQVFGVPPEASGIDPSCAKITITEGLQHLEGFSLGQGFQTITIDPDAGHQGTVSGRVDLAGCGFGNLNFDFTFQVDSTFAVRITGQPAGATNVPVALNIEGVPPDVVIDGACSSVQLTQGADLLSGSPWVGGTVGLSPAPGVQGSVNGTVILGENENGACEVVAQAPLGEVRFDTRAPACAETGVGEVSCDEPVALINDSTGQSFQGAAGQKVNVGIGDQGFTDLRVVDGAGNTSYVSTIRPTTCWQSDTQLRFNSQTNSVEIHVNCDGSGDLSVAGGIQNAPISKGEVWVPVPIGAQGGSISVNFHGKGTGSEFTVPDQVPPTLIRTVHIEGGAAKLDAICTTALQDPCTIQANGETAQVAGNGSQAASFGADVQVGSNGQFQVAACDTMGNCTQPEAIASGVYAPFDGAGLTTLKIADTKIEVRIDHPDPTSSLNGHIGLKVEQAKPFKDVAWVQDLIRFGEELFGKADPQCAQTQHTRDFSLYTCDLPWSHGQVNVWAQTQEKGQEFSPIYTSSVGIPDYSPNTQKAVEAVPYMMAMFVFALLAANTAILYRARQQRIDRERDASAVAIINKQGPISEKATIGLEKPLRKKASKKNERAILLLKLLEQKQSLHRIRRDGVKPARGYNHRNLTRFMETFSTQDEALLQREGFTGFTQEVEDVREILFLRLNEYIKTLNSHDVSAVLSHRPAERTEAGEFLMSLYGMKDDSWFWKKTRKQEKVHSTQGRPTFVDVPKYPHLTRDSLRRGIVRYLHGCGILEENRTKLFNLFNPAGQAVQVRQHDIDIILKGSTA